MKNTILTIVALLATSTTLSSAYSPISLSTKSKLPQTPPNELFQFLASPANWPKIVASSSSVESPPNSNKKNVVDLTQPLPQGQSVNEIFGLPPLFPLSVTWQCVKSIPPTNTRSGRLEFYSIDGVPGIATRCKMNFDIDTSTTNERGSNLLLEMEYEPQSPLAVLATPILTVDNALALKVLLPSVLHGLSTTTTSTAALDKFRSLMGTLYGIAGLVHAYDLIYGGSQLLVAAGAPPFEALPLQGQAVAILWCLVGPLSFVKSRIGGNIADLGLILYGLVEVAGAGAIRIGYGAGNLDPLVNAILVQGIVGLSWLYSSQKKED
jgi:hypothetical protein